MMRQRIKKGIRVVSDGRPDDPLMASPYGAGTTDTKFPAEQE